ncbi:MAG: FAD-binding protein [Candidatus Obscuribacter sp.]|nr:FAD-binding protein [Candidatus Obscuribacter sp.]
MGLEDICNVMERGSAASFACVGTDVNWFRVQPATLDELAALFHIFSEAALVPYYDRKLKSLLVSDTVFVDMKKLSAVTENVVSDLVMAVQCGITVYELRQILSEQKQIFPVSRVYDDLSLAQLLALGDAGACESGYGQLRSNILGFEFLDAQGRRTKCGGRVVKNVTGYDVSKLFVGSGRLALPYLVYLRLFARAEAAALFLVQGQAPELLRFSGKLLGSGINPYILELVPGEDGGFRLYIGLDGPAPMVDELKVLLNKLSSAEGLPMVQCADDEAEEMSFDAAAMERLEVFLSMEGLAFVLRKLSRTPAGIRAGTEAGSWSVRVRPATGRLIIDCSSSPADTDWLAAMDAAERCLTEALSLWKQEIETFSPARREFFRWENFSVMKRVAGRLIDTAGGGALASQPQKMGASIAGSLESGLDPQRRFHPFVWPERSRLSQVGAIDP